jgi:hypothetical protein
MKEKIDELYEGLKERLKSNFLITFIIIWLLHHWRLIYTIFNFDKDQTLISKKAFIAKYISDEGMLWLWIVPLLWSFCSMILFYCFSSLSELLNIRYHNLRKMIYKRWDNKKIKTIEEFLEVIAEKEKVQAQIIELERRRDTILAINERLENTIGENNKLITNNRSTIESYTRSNLEISDKNKVLEKDNKELTDSNTLLIAEKKNFEHQTKEFEDLKKSYEDLEKQYITLLENNPLRPNLSNDEIMVLTEIFGTGTWSISYDNDSNFTEAFTYSNGVFSTATQEEIRITDVHFDDGVLRFKKHNPKRNIHGLLNILTLKDRNELKGTEGNSKVTYKRIRI